MDALDCPRITKVVCTLMSAGFWMHQLASWYFSDDERNEEYNFLGNTISAGGIVLGGAGMELSFP